MWSAGSLYTVAIRTWYNPNHPLVPWSVLSTDPNQGTLYRVICGHQAQELWLRLLAKSGRDSGLCHYFKRLENKF